MYLNIHFNLESIDDLSLRLRYLYPNKLRGTYHKIYMHILEI
jgi:hypothetical protein